MSAIERIPLYPLLLAETLVLALFLDSAASVYALGRPAAVAASVALIGTGLIGAVARDRHIGAFYISVIVTVLMGVWIVALALIVLRVALALARRPMGELTGALNVIASFALIVGIGNTWAADVMLPPVGERVQPATGPGPDVYLILLDGYPRADTLAEDFDFDNRPFLEEMSSLGFDIADQAQSNYNLTSLTLASMLNATHITDQPEMLVPGVTAQAQYRTLARAINRASSLDAFRVQGYEIATVTSPFSGLSIFSADRVLSGGISDLELDLLGEGLVPFILPDFQRQVLTDVLRDRVTEEFDQTVRLSTDSPTLVLTHVMSPHPPILFAADGSPVSGRPCFPVCSAWDPGNDRGAEVRQAFVGQITHLNGLVLATAHRLIDRDGPPPVIIVFSDHGHRLDYDDTDELLRSLLLAYTPGRAGLFPRDATPINILPRILEAYGDGDPPLASEESYWTDMSTAIDQGPLTVPPQEVAAE